DKIRNEELLRRVEKERTIKLDTIRKRKTSWLGHILRRDYLQRRIMEEKIEGRRSRGRKKFGMLTDILKERTFEQLKEAAQNGFTNEELFGRRARWRFSPFLGDCIFVLAILNLNLNLFYKIFNIHEHLLG
ncbi:hypothetical protein WDU94_010673, partial [Cyamophila willieti]